MKQNEPIDYQAALNQFRKLENDPDNPVRSSDRPSTPPQKDSYVDYQMMVKEWDKEQEGVYKIHLQTGKRNPSHDPVYIASYDA